MPVTLPIAENPQNAENRPQKNPKKNVQNMIFRKLDFLWKIDHTPHFVQNFAGIISSIERSRTETFDFFGNFFPIFFPDPGESHDMTMDDGQYGIPKKGEYGQSLSPSGDALY